MKILYGDGIHDDTEALQAMEGGEKVRRPNGEIVHYLIKDLPNGTYRLTKTLHLEPRMKLVRRPIFWLLLLPVSLLFWWGIIRLL